MLAYQVHTNGYGYTADLPETTKFFWSKISAGNFCEAQLDERIISSVRRYVADAGKYELFGKYHTDTIRKHESFQKLNHFIAASPVMSLAEMAAYILAHETDLRGLIPSKKHPFHTDAKAQVNELVWLCVRIRKQFKQSV